MKRGLEKLLSFGLAFLVSANVKISASVLPYIYTRQAIAHHCSFSEEEFENVIAEIMNNAINKDERWDFCRYSLAFDDKDTLQFKFQYIPSKEGLRAIFYLAPSAWYSAKAIDNLQLYLINAEQADLKVKIYEINVNFYNKTVNYVPITERMLIGDYFMEKVGKGLFSVILEKISMSKENLKKFLESFVVVDEILKKLKEEKIKQKAALIARDRVVLTKLDYKGFGRFDENIFYFPYVFRAPKLVEIEIEGEKPIGFVLTAQNRSYKTQNIGIMEIRRVVKNSVAISAPLP